MKNEMTKPVRRFRRWANCATGGKRMGHARGNHLWLDKARLRTKIRALKDAGIAVADSLDVIGETVARSFNELN